MFSCDAQTRWQCKGEGLMCTIAALEVGAADGTGYHEISPLNSKIKLLSTTLSAISPLPLTVCAVSHPAAHRGTSKVVTQVLPDCQLSTQ